MFERGGTKLWRCLETSEHRTLCTSAISESNKPEVKSMRLEHSRLSPLTIHLKALIFWRCTSPCSPQGHPRVANSEEEIGLDVLTLKPESWQGNRSPGGSEISLGSHAASLERLGLKPVSLLDGAVFGYALLVNYLKNTGAFQDVFRLSSRP